jgi:hypothetical protein
MDKISGLKVLGDDQGIIDEEEYQLAITLAGPIVNTEQIKVIYFLC